MRTSVRHRQYASTRVLKLEALISKLRSIYRLASCSYSNGLDTVST